VACVLVHIEAEGDRPTTSSLGALGAGRRLASRFGATLYAVVLTTADGEQSAAESSVRIGPIDAASLGRAPLVGELARGGADKVVFVTVEQIRFPPLWATEGGAIASTCEYLRPLVVIMPTSRGGHDIAPRLAARLGAAYIPDAELDLGQHSVAVQRKVLGGHVRRWVLDDLDRAAVITVAAGTAPARGDDDAEVMLLPVAADVDDRIVSATAPVPPRAKPDEGEVQAALATTLETEVPPNVAVLIRGLLSGPGTIAAAPLGGVERAAIDTAVALGRGLGVEIAAIAAGAAAIHDRALTAALAAGCSRAIRIDTALADEIDYLGLAQILAQGIRRADAGVILCGDRSSDEGTGAVGPAVAELTDAAHLTGVDAVELEGDVMIARRGTERLRVSPSIVLCIAATADAPDPAPPPTGTIEVLGLDTLGLDPRVLTHRRATAGAITSGAKDETVPGVPTPDFGPEPDA
jgi:electron transfer flavoprotein alpha subunit